MAETAKMPIMSHFSEMRRRFFRSVIAIVVATVLAFVFYNQIFDFLLAPGPEDMQLQAIELMENLSAIFKVCLTAGFIIAMPFIVYQFFAFLAPALRTSEKRYVYTALPFIGGLFLAGVAFAYYVALPAALNFLLTFGSDIASPEIRISNYINIVTRLLVAVGGWPASARYGWWWPSSWGRLSRPPSTPLTRLLSPYRLSSYMR